MLCNIGAFKYVHVSIIRIFVTLLFVPYNSICHHFNVRIYILGNCLFLENVCSTHWCINNISNTFPCRIRLFSLSAVVLMMSSLSPPSFRYQTESLQPWMGMLPKTMKALSPASWTWMTFLTSTTRTSSGSSSVSAAYRSALWENYTHQWICFLTLHATCHM